MLAYLGIGIVVVFALFGAWVLFQHILWNSPLRNGEPYYVRMAKEEAKE